MLLEHGVETALKTSLGMTALDLVKELKADRRDRWEKIADKLHPVHVRSAKGQGAL